MLISHRLDDIYSYLSFKEFYEFILNFFFDQNNNQEILIFFFLNYFVNYFSFLISKDIWEWEKKKFSLLFSARVKQKNIKKEDGKTTVLIVKLFVY